MILSKSMLRAVAALVAALAATYAPEALPQDSAQYCNAVQNRIGLIRYPLGTIGAWSTPAGEMADVMTRVPRVYPCLNSVAVKPAKEDWRSTVSGDPAMLSIKYKADKPSGASTLAITVSPHSSVFQVTFPEGQSKKFLVFDFSKGAVDEWARLSKWTDRTVTRIDNHTLQATLGNPGQSNAYYLLRFSAPCIGSGTIDTAGNVTEGASQASGVGAGMYAQFETSTVAVAIVESFTSIERAREFMGAECESFEVVHQRCQAAWKRVLNAVELEGGENFKRMAYTALYTMYANIIDGSDGSCYLKYYSRPRSIASSAYWQFIGGFQSCCWDNVRAVYPFLMLAYPEVMSDVVNTYLARYQRDGSVEGDACLFTGPTGGHHNVRLSPALMSQAYYSGIQADYSQIYAALKNNFDDPAEMPSTVATLGYVTQPPSGGKACSETLEFATGLHSLALLAKANQDQDGFRKYMPLSKCYTNLWDATNKVFRVRDADGTWGVINNTNWTWNPNPQGLFEGTSRDWMCSVPHDPYGLIHLPGQEDFVERVVGYCLNDTWFNDNQYVYPYLLYWAGAPNEAQRIIRTSWVPMFESGIMYEGVRPKPPHNGWQTHYTSNSGWLLCSMLGLYPVPAPPGQFVIASPSLSRAVLHNGPRKLTLRTSNGSGSNIYVTSIKVDGKPYPCYMIPARRLAAGATIDLEMGDDPAQGLGSLYIGSSDGFVLSAELVTPSHLKCVIEAAAPEAITQIHSQTKPEKVLLNGRADSGWRYIPEQKVLVVPSNGTASIEVIAK